MGNKARWTHVPQELDIRWILTGGRRGAGRCTRGPQKATGCYRELVWYEDPTSQALFCLAFGGWCSPREHFLEVWCLKMPAIKAPVRLDNDVKVWCLILLIQMPLVSALIKMYAASLCHPWASLICSRESLKGASQPCGMVPPHLKAKCGPVTGQPCAQAPLIKC